MYRIKGGRTDNQYGPQSEGELEVWANDQKIVTVKDNLGYTLLIENPVELVGPYFKFGLYRAGYRASSSSSSTSSHKHLGKQNSRSAASSLGSRRDIVVFQPAATRLQFEGLFKLSSDPANRNVDRVETMSRRRFSSRAWN